MFYDGKHILRGRERVKFFREEGDRLLLNFQDTDTLQPLILDKRMCYFKPYELFSPGNLIEFFYDTKTAEIVTDVRLCSASQQ